MMNIINEYIDANGKVPYSAWLSSLKDKKARAIVIARVDRMEIGNFGNSKALGDGVLELRIDYGSGYRVYYAREDTSVYLLLCGGDKSSQHKDIELAKRYWIDYHMRKLNDARTKH